MRMPPSTGYARACEYECTRDSRHRHRFVASFASVTSRSLERVRTATECRARSEIFPQLVRKDEAPSVAADVSEESVNSAELRKVSHLGCPRGATRPWTSCNYLVLWPAG
jgi:hypothetical protein